jgi:hypothetical protein
MEKGPIFIAGSSYSGKTQLRLMLSAHPNIIITRRTYLWKGFRNCFGDLSKRANFERCLASILSDRHIQKLNPIPRLIRSEYWQGNPGYSRLFCLIHEHFAAQQGKTRWGVQHKSIDKDIEHIFSSLPNAVVLHMVRHPFDRVGESVSRSTHRKGKVGLETSFWRHSARRALRNQKKYPAQYLIVKCEDLFENPEKTLREICDFIDEDYSLEMLNVSGLLEMGINVPFPPAKANKLVPGNNNQSEFGLTHTEKIFIQSRISEEMAALEYLKIDKHLSLKRVLNLALVVYPSNIFVSSIWTLWNRGKLLFT